MFKGYGDERPARYRGLRRWSLAATAPNLVAAAATLREPVTLGVVATTDEVAAQGALAGVDAIVTVRPPSDASDADVHAAAVRVMIEEIKPRVVVMAYSIRSAAFAAALAETLDLGFASDVVALERGAEGALLATRPVYGGKVYAELAFSADAPALVLLRADTGELRKPPTRHHHGSCRFRRARGPASRTSNTAVPKWAWTSPWRT